MESRLIGTIAAVVLAIASAPSLATTAIAKLQNINIALTDLDLTDGIDPRLFDPFAEGGGYLFFLDGHELLFQTFPMPFLGAGDVTVPYGQWPNAGASGSMSPAEGIVVEADATAPGTAYAQGYTNTDWTVTPFTTVTLSGTAVLDNANGLGSASVAFCLGGCYPASFVDGTQTYVFVNDTPLFAEVDIWLSAYAQVPGIPEPPTSVLLLAAGALLISRPGIRQIARASSRAV